MPYLQAGTPPRKSFCLCVFVVNHSYSMRSIKIVLFENLVFPYFFLLMIHTSLLSCLDSLFFLVSHHVHSEDVLSVVSKFVFLYSVSFHLETYTQQYALNYKILH